MSENTGVSKEVKKKKVSWKTMRKKSRLFYKVMHQNPKPNLALYMLELILVFPLEILRKVLVILKNLVLFGVVVGLLVGTIGLAYLYPTLSEWNSDAERIVTAVNKSDFNINEASTIYASDGSILAIIKEDAETSYLEYDDIPQYAIDAFVAVEDRSFWSNPGFDIKGIMIAVYEMVTSEDQARGASTITQQLVKNTYLTSERSIERKFKEILISSALTKQFSKREIMEFYINNNCYANGIYGLSGAAKAYFDTDVNDLSLSQIAYLCAIPNRPSYYDPLVDSTTALDRRDKILEDMYECGYITEAQMMRAKAEKIVIKQPEKVFNDTLTTFAVDCAIEYLMKLDGFNFQYEFTNWGSYEAYNESYINEYDKMKHELYTGGYKIYTSLDKDLYNKLQAVLDENLAFNDSINEETGVYQLQGALTCIDNETGKVVALVGGRSQENNDMIYSLNRAFQSYRQPGSTFKPIAVYTPALESDFGYTANTTVYNISVTEAKKKGVDVQALRGEAHSLRSAVEWSKNGVAWQVFDKITPQVGMKYITDMGFRKICPDDYYNASSLGGLTYGTTTVEMASAYATLANHGDYKEPTCIVKMLNREDKNIFQEYESKEIYTAKSADDMVDILKGVLIRGTASSLGWSNKSKIDAFAKTGTTNDSKDGWLCGSTPYYSIAVWVGYDTPKAMSSLYGNTYPGRIWRDSMLVATEGFADANFERLVEDDSYLAKQGVVATEGYYSYLEGRDDSEVLSEGYTVADYRTDRVIGESVISVVNQINGLDMSISGATDRLQQLYSEGISLLDTIYSVKYTEEMRTALDTAYNAKLAIGGQ